jgi:flagellar hook-basal body complex protein FliE
VKEGFLPWEFEVKGEDPDLVFHYGCERANCTFNIRVDTKPAEKLKSTTQVNTEHNHALTSLSQGAREEAKKSIRRLKNEFREEALKEMESIREAARTARETTASVRAKQDQVLEDYLLAIGKRKMEKFREEAAEAGILVNRGSRVRQHYS